MIHLFSRAAAAASFMLGAMLATPGFSHDAPAPFQQVVIGTLTISSAYARATLPNAPVGAAYLTITNNGPADDRLISASSPIAGVTQLHEMKMVNDVMQMNELPDGVVIPADQSVMLEPGGFHVMLMNLNGPLTEGETFAVTLTFEKAGSIEVQVPIGPFDAAAGGHMDMGDMESSEQMVAP